MSINLNSRFICSGKKTIECFHSRGQHLCKFIGTKESVYIRKEFNSHRNGLVHQHGRRFIVLGQIYGRHDVMWKHSLYPSSFPNLSIKSRIRIINFWTAFFITVRVHFCSVCFIVCASLRNQYEIFSLFYSFRCWTL